MQIDNGVPVRDSLLGADASTLLNAALAEAGGACHSAQAVQVRYVPERSITVQYRAEVKWHDGRETSETLVAASGLKVPGATVRIEFDGVEVSVWRYPQDPFLPGLAVAAHPDGAGEILRQLGAPADAIRLKRRAYRPGRRAVIEVAANGARIFIKMVRPHRVADLQARHHVMGGRVGVPRSYGWSEELGLVAIQAIPGLTLRKAIVGGSRRLPTGRALFALLQRLPEVPPGPRAGPLARVEDHARLMSIVHPSLESRLVKLVDTLHSRRSAWSTVHGDFHASQVLVDGGRIIGLIDVDTAGQGQIADDLATMLGQISTLALGPNGARFKRYGEEILGEFDELVDPHDLRVRTAASALGYAVGPFRVQERGWREQMENRLALAERWATRAGPDRT